MRAIWTGAISFGLVNVPVKVYSATEDHDLGLHQVHDQDGGRIRYQRRCEICGKIVPYDHIDKAFDSGDRTVVITAEDLASLPAEKSREIDVVEFVPSEQVDPIRFDRAYFLEPDERSPKAYVLLRRTLEETDRTAIVTFSLRQKTRLGVLRVRGKVIMLQSLLWDDEVREAEFPILDTDVRISQKELELSEALTKTYAADFHPENYADDYQVELRKLVEAKLEEGDSVDTAVTFGETPESSDDGGEVIDLMEALRKSVERGSGASRAQGATSADDDAAAGAGAKSRAKSSAKSASESSTRGSSPRASKGSTAKSGRGAKTASTAKSASSTSASKTSRSSAKAAAGAGRDAESTGSTAKRKGA